jgi:cytochrome b561
MQLRRRRILANSARHRRAIRLSDSESHANQKVPEARHNYDLAQRGFHWVMAVIIFAAIALGVRAGLLPAGVGIRPQLLDVHKSLGVTALILVLFRVVYRPLRGEPEYREPPDALTHAAAQAAHWALYALMIFMPVTGYVFSAGGGHDLPFFGLFEWPSVVPRDRAMAQFAQGLHYAGAWMIGALLALHILAVIWHVWIRRDEVLARMWPRGAADGA